ncbi:unnamed protein product, partial [Darwinula stevensoni]
VVIRPMMYVALTYDHPLIDGREAVTFLRKFKQAVEDPRCLLLGLSPEDEAFDPFPRANRPSPSHRETAEFIIRVHRYRFIHQQGWNFEIEVAPDDQRLNEAVHQHGRRPEPDRDSSVRVDAVEGEARGRSGLEDFPWEVLLKMAVLTSLDVSGGSLAALPALRSHVLEDLALADNRVSAVEGGWFLPNLIDLDLPSCCELRQLHIFSSGKAPNIKEASVFDDSVFRIQPRPVSTSMCSATEKRIVLALFSLLLSLAPRTSGQFPRPDPEDNSPCTCSHDGQGENITLDCTLATTSEIFFAFNDVAWFSNLTILIVKAFRMGKKESGRTRPIFTEVGQEEDRNTIMKAASMRTKKEKENSTWM